MYILYQKSGKYPYVNERSDESDNSCDIFKKLTGMSVSAGSVIYFLENSQTNQLQHKNAVFVDGRYKLAAKLSLDSNKFDILDNKISVIIKWIKENIPINSEIACDMRFFSIKTLDRIKNSLSESYKIRSVNLDKVLHVNLPKRSLKIHVIPKNCIEQKIVPLQNLIFKNNLDAFLLCDSCSISWLLNIRDFSSSFSPVVFGYLLFEKNANTGLNATLYLDELYSEVINPADCSVKIKSEKELPIDLQKISAIGIDETETSAYIEEICSRICQKVYYQSNPFIVPKAIKNRTEIEDIKQAALRDSAAIVTFLHWLYESSENNTAEKSPLTEIDVAKKLVEIRKQNENYVEESFQCISAADEHSAIIHYSPTENSNASINNILLLDTGAQYKYGTTDITRTICLHKPTDEEKKFYTLVLKGHIALAQAIFPAKTDLRRLDLLARQFLWENEADYPHSTSHGIGYMLSVHEPLSEFSSIELQAGMIISNEPGFYKENYFGIRLENMMLIKENSGGWLSFETISLIPFDYKLIDIKMLSDSEKQWLNQYNEKIYEKLSPIIPEKTKEWLKRYM